jgi:predicted negative regulator of RcsB-dependent stress response
MAKELDLQEQEQLDALKAFWNTWGNLITWVLIAVLTAFAGWNGWQWYQRDQGEKAGAIYDELERAVQAGDVDKAARIAADLKAKHPSAVFTEHGALAVARLQVDKNQADAAKASLAWVADNAGQEDLRAVARLRLAGLHLDAGQYDQALLQLDGIKAAEFAGLVADRRGDILAAQGKNDEAKAAYLAAFKAMPESLQYRVLVEAKLTALGSPPPAADAAASAPSGSKP